MKQDGGTRVVLLKHSERLLTLISNSTVSDSNITAVIVQVGGVSHIYAGMAQLAEQLTCNQQVVGSSPTLSS